MTRLIILLALVLSGCSYDYPNRAIVGEAFPSVTGTSLENQSHGIPEDFSVEPVAYLVGYVQDSQFDIDRWLIGLDMTQTDVKAIELPTIKGMFPRMFRTRIDGGMRKGIPKELWGGVITIYEDGDRVQRFTGNTNPRNARVLLVDSQGVVRFSHDRGFSVAALNELRSTLAKLRAQHP